MVTKVLCVAEKPSIAKAVANHLADGAVTVVSYCTPYSTDDNMLMKEIA